MAEIDGLRFELEIEKQLLFVLLTAGLAVAGWLVSHFAELPLGTTTLAGVAICADAILLAFLRQSIQNKIRRLKEI